MTISGARPQDESKAFALWFPVIRQHESQVNNGSPGCSLSSVRIRCTCQICKWHLSLAADHWLAVGAVAKV